MYCVALLFAFLATCGAHAVLPLAHHVPAVAPVLPVAPYLHGYAGHGVYDHGYGGHGVYGHGYYGHGYGKPLVHHVLKRSPHLVAPVDHLGAVGHLGAGHLGGIGHLGAVGHLAPVAHVAPLAVAPAAVSHQSRVDVHTAPLVAPVVAPLLHSAPLLHKPVLPYHHAGGYYGGAYLHSLGHY